jgi:5-methyltetrahydrofolate--homocysteine methyltransferase
MQPFAERLVSGRPLVCDGATGTMLIERGLEPGRPPESMTLSHSDVLEEIARLYAEAGADIVVANTFGGSPLRLAQYELDGKTREINRVALEAVRRAGADRVYVAASCGPSGALLEPYGDTDSGTVAAGFREQLEHLFAVGLDCLIVETMVDLAEAKLAIQAAKEISPHTPVLATMTFDATPRGFFTVMGVSVETAASGLQEAGADAVGSNCGNGSESMVEIARAFRACTDLPLIVQPNAGLPEVRGGMTVYGETPEFMAAKAEELLDIGVSVIGGCCGTTPEHIKAVRATVDASG